MDQMQNAVKVVCADFIKLIEERLGNIPVQNYKVDTDLTKPWKDFVADAHTHAENQIAMERIEEHVRKVRKEWGKKREAKGSGTNRRRSDKAVDFTNLPISERQDILRALSQSFASGLDDLRITIGRNGPSIPILVASCAYCVDYQISGSWTRFPWDVAFRDLCEIKAKALGLSKTVTANWYFSALLKPSLVFA